MMESDPDAPATSAPAPGQAPSDASTVRFTARQTTGDVIWHGAETARRSGILIVFGTFVTVISAVPLVLGDPLSIIGVLFGLSMLTGLFAVPFVWWAVRQRRDLMLDPVSFEIDDEGVSMSTSSVTSRTAWSVYRQARETRRAFVLETGTTASIIMLKRAMGAEIEASIRERLQRLGLLSEPTLARRLRPLLWVGVGLLAVGVLVALTVFFGKSGANVALETVPTVAGRHVTIDGTTDLPDGTLLAVQVFQFDAWNRAQASGGSAAADFSYIDNAYAVVKDGHFSAAVDMTGWPAGHGMSAVYFWIDGSQPPAVIERFGRDGSGLHGPDVLPDEDTGPTLRVDHAFDIPE